MNIKDIFAKAENGTLTYDQFVKLAGEEAKFVDLKEGGYVAKMKYDDDLKARDTRITDLDTTVKSREADLAKLQEQLKSAGTDAEKLATLSGDFASLQKKYDKDTKELEAKLKDQNYRHAVTDFANAQKFTSGAAKRDFIGAMIAKKLQMENDTIIGATDFMSAYKTENADAFEAEPAPNTNPAPAENKPHFVDSTNGANGNNSGAPTTPFNFNFTGIRPHENK